MIQDLKFFLFIILFLVFTPFFGYYMAGVYSERFIFLYPLERFIYKMLGIPLRMEMDYKQYLKCLLLFTLYGFLFVLAVQLAQGYLPFNPQNFGAVPFWLAVNTAISFATNTNFQSYAGETTLSYFTQMVALTSQNFLSASLGICTLLALTRGIVGQGKNLGNFYKDFTKSILYILLPLSILFSIIFVFEGIIQNLSPYIEVTTLEGATQILPMGPVASQEAIKQLGTNGGGFFGVNSAHPFENPTFLTNLLQNFAILFLPASCVFMYGRMLRNRRQASVLFLTMCFLWILSLVAADFFQVMSDKEFAISPNLEGQEMRIASFRSVLWTVSTTATGNGSVNSMISSFSPMTGGIALLNMMLGEVIFGGVGVGLAGMLIFALLTVFIAGLMVGRTPEYMGKKIEKKEIQWVMLAILAPGAMILVSSGLAMVVPQALASITNPGPHGLTEILYAITSSNANNGSAMASLNTNTNFFNILLGILMMNSRIIIMICSLSIAGLLGPKKHIPVTSGTFRTDTHLFAYLQISIILIFVGLTFFPVITLGPILEQLLFAEHRTF